MSAKSLELDNEIKRLKSYILELETEIRLLKTDLNQDSSNYKSNIKNARGAGRKRKVSDYNVLELRKSGMTVKEIANKLNIGVATVNRALNPNLRHNSK